MTLFWFVIPLHLLVFGLIFLMQFDQIKHHTNALERSLVYVLGFMFLVSDVYMSFPVSFQYFHLSDFGLIENIEVAFAFICIILLIVLSARVRSGKRYAYLFFSFIFLIICLEEIRYGTVFFSHYNDADLTNWHNLLITMQESEVWDSIVDILLSILQITSILILISPGLTLAEYSNPRRVLPLFISNYGRPWGGFKVLLRLLLAFQFNFACYLVPASMSCGSSEFQQLTYLLCAITCLGFWTFSSNNDGNTQCKSKVAIQILVLITIMAWMILWTTSLVMNTKKRVAVSFKTNSEHASQCAEDLTADHLKALPEDGGIRIYGMLNNHGDIELEEILIRGKVFAKDGRIIANEDFAPFNGAPAVEKIEDGKSRFFYGTIPLAETAARVELGISKCRERKSIHDGWRSHTEQAE